MVDGGVTLTVDVLAPPAFALHVNVEAPLAVSTTLEPEQVGVAPETEIVGVGETSTKAVVLAVQVPFAPTNVYVFVPGGGVTLIVLVFCPPGNHV